MSLLFRGLLLVGALLAFAYILRKIRKSEIKIADSTFWFLFSLGVVLLALFPQITGFFCRVFSIESPVNFVYLVIITILVIKQFQSTVEMASLRNKVATLVQEEALERHDIEALQGGLGVREPEKRDETLANAQADSPAGGCAGAGE